MKHIRIHIIFITAAFFAPLVATAVSRATSSALPPDLRGTADQPLVIKTIPTAEELRRAAEYRADRAVDLAARNRASMKEDRNDKITEAIGIATVLILVIQAAAFLYQARKMRESVREMRAATRVAERAAEMARTSADAAVDANRLNREALIADQRPWLEIIRNPVLFFSTLPDAKWQLTLETSVQNTGKTPAREVRTHAQLLELANPPDIERAHLAFCQSAAELTSPTTAEVCFPGGKLVVSALAQIPEHFQTSPLRRVFVLSGCVAYWFPEAKTVHRSSFLYRVTVADSNVSLHWMKRDRPILAGNLFSSSPASYGWTAN